jgi:hypothetical protein
MATFLRQSDCAGEPDANPTCLRDPDAISRSVKSNKIFIAQSDPVRKGSHVEVHFIFKSDKNYYGKWAFYLIEKHGGTSLYGLYKPK